MPYVSVYVDPQDILDDLTDADILDAIKDRKLSLAVSGDGYRLDRLIDDLKDVVFEINMGRKEWALTQITKMIDQIEGIDRVVSNQLGKPPLEKSHKAGKVAFTTRRERTF